MDDYARDGNLYLVKQLHLQNQLGTHFSLNLAILNNHFEVVKYLVENVPIRYRQDEAMLVASGHGYFHIIKYLHTFNFKPCSVSMYNAIENNHIDIAQYLIDYYNMKLPDSQFAYMNLTLDTIKWLLTKNIERKFVVQMLSSSVYNAKYDCVFYLLNKTDCKLDEIHEENTTRLDKYRTNLLKLIFAKVLLYNMIPSWRYRQVKNEFKEYHPRSVYLHSLVNSWQDE